MLSGCYVADGSAIVLGFHGFAVVWEHDGLAELQALPAGGATDRVTQLHSAVACGRLLLFATVRGSRQEVICWDLARLAVVSRLDLMPMLTGSRRNVVRIAAAAPGAAASLGLRLLAFQATGALLQVWRLAERGGGELGFEPEASATLPEGHCVLDAAFAGFGSSGGGGSEAGVDRIDKASARVDCPVLCWTTRYELWHLDLTASVMAPAQKVSSTSIADELEEPPAKVAASGRVAGIRRANAGTAGRGTADLRMLDFPLRTTAAQQAGLVPQLVAKVISPHTPSHMLPAPHAIWESLLAVYGKPSPSAERDSILAGLPTLEAVAQAHTSAQTKALSKQASMLPPWMQGETLADPGTSAEVVEGDFFDALVKESTARLS